MAIESKKDVWELVKRQIPDVFVKRRFNFITIHYMYIMGMSLLLSVIIYAIGDIDYIDALFFASGSCTQSGLNTIDVNLLRTGQQIMLYIGGMLCNPIAINSVVVFVRLYWFEKRFQHVVREARNLRRTKTRGLNGTFSKDDPEAARQEVGVRGRAIQILRNTGRVEKPPQVQKEVESSNGNEGESSDTSRKPSDDSHQFEPKYHSLDLTRTRSSEQLRLPQQMDPEQHIRFLEAQRNPSEGALRIPSPREFDRGGKPENIDDADGHGLLLRQVTTNVEGLLAAADEKRDRSNTPGPRVGQHITINEPQIVRNKDRPTPGLPRANTTKPNQKPHDIPVPLSQNRHKRAATFSSFRRSNTGLSLEPTPYLSYQPTIGRNSMFVNLTEEQREELGGIEYRALKTLAIILVAYFFCFHAFGVVGLVPWIWKSATYSPAVTSQGQGRTWWGFFTAASAFNDLGFTLTNNSMISFGTAVWPMLLMSFLIIIGNTGFPCMLRFTIWFVSLFVPIGTGLWEELQFLLDHPRRCFTLLFPGTATWWLFGILICLNGIDIIFFIVLDLHDPTVTSLAPFIRFIDGLFQAAATRTAGFAVVNLAELHPAIQVSYLIMMYISVFPIAISMRRTNVYEERSLGIYASPTEQAEDENEPSYVGAHLRKQLSFDLWYVFLGLFLIAIIEGRRLENTNEYAFTIFSVLFEIVSAYGTVGLSLGYPTINASFSAEFKTLSKLIIIAMQIRGRHRGLPYEVDRAIMLPSESLHAKEAKEAHRMVLRRPSLAASTMSAVDGHMGGFKFRPETGLNSGIDNDASASGIRERRNAVKTTSMPLELAEKHNSHARSGLGNAMFRLASAPEAVKDELHHLDNEIRHV